MEKILFAISLTLLSFSIMAQNKSEDNISNKVKTELKQLYPYAKSIKWSSHDEELINASFTIKGKRINVLFKADTLFADMIEMNKNKLPKAVTNHVKSYYEGYSIIQAYKIKTSPKDMDRKTRYWITIGKDKVRTTLICYSNGNEMTAFSKQVKKKN